MSFARHTMLGSAALVSLLAACSDPSSTSHPDSEGPTQQTAQALTSSNAPDNPQNFDFDNGNIITDYIIATGIPVIWPYITGGDATIILYMTSTALTGWFDTIAPYSDKMVGVYSRIPRRPPSERTDRNRNIAIAHAAYHLLTAYARVSEPQWRAMMEHIGINVSNDTMDLTTPAGIGNYAAKKVLDARKRDGFNRDGDEGGRKYNLPQYADYTGYEPPNSPYVLTNPSKWQPKITTSGLGIFKVQNFVTPQYGQTKPYSVSRSYVKNLAVPPPWRSDYKKNPAAYKAQADDVLEKSANLTDYQKLLAEYFNDKFLSLGFAADFVRRRDGQSLEEFVQYDFVAQVAAFDAGISIWADKREYDAVRPYTAIKFLYGKKKIRAWGGVGKGTVNDITGNEWESYLPVADHPEYPSGSACFCAAQAQATRRWTNSDAMNFSMPFPPGSSTIEPGITPKETTTLAFNTFTDWVNACADSRVLGGVHFRAAVEASVEPCTKVGNKAYEWALPFINGTAPTTDDDQGPGGPGGPGGGHGGPGGGHGGPGGGHGGPGGGHGH